MSLLIFSSRTGSLGTEEHASSAYPTSPIRTLPTTSTDGKTAGMCPLRTYPTRLVSPTCPSVETVVQADRPPSGQTKNQMNLYIVSDNIRSKR